MITTLEVGDVERFRAAIANRLGLRFEDAKCGFLGEVLGRRLDAFPGTRAIYLDHLESRDGRDELDALASELTVPETYFFRNIDQFRALSQHVARERIRSRGEARRLRMLSAGCASGEEPYSIAMTLRETIDPSWQTTILAVDVNPVVLDRANRGRFSTWALRETPPDAQARWFKRDGREVTLADSIKTAVKFERRNLAEDDPDLWRRETYDVIFCRNVMMYFTPEQARALVARLARSLVPGGYLFLGHAETLRGLSEDFHLCHTHGAFFYRRKSAGEPSSPLSFSGSAQDGTFEADLLPFSADENPTWVNAIRDATERVEQLTAARATSSTSPVVLKGPQHRHRPNLVQVLDWLQQERFAEALELVAALPADTADETEVLLVQAVLLTHAGLLTRAEYACRRLLERDKLSAAAHYLLALCRDGSGDRDAAAFHDRIAASLDPGFGMPRLHLGLLARREGDLKAVQRELDVAVALLEREDASRLLLFGGGFSREALIALCRAEMRDNGDRS